MKRSELGNGARAAGRPLTLLVVGVSLLGIGVGLGGCKSRPRGTIYIARNKDHKPKLSQKELADRELAELVQQPHIRDVRYQKFIRPLFTRSGCASGACHGEYRGGGLYFQADSPRNRHDYDEILLRLDRAHPEKSELVQKILNQLPHNGGRNIDPKSCDYARLIAWIGDKPDPECTDPVPPDDAVRFAREAAPALSTMGCADKACHGSGGAAQTRFNLEGLTGAAADPARPAQIDKARQEVRRFAGWKAAPWRAEIVRAANAEDGIHKQKIDPQSCAYARMYSYLADSQERTCAVAAPLPPQPSLEVFTTQVIPGLNRRGCLQVPCHGGGSGGMYLIAGELGEPAALHSYLMLLDRVEDLAHIDNSTLLRTARNKEPHGGGVRLGGKGDCVDDQISAWLHRQPIQPCKPPVPPTFESFVAQVQPVLEKMTCTNLKCHGGSIPHFQLAYKATLPAQLMKNYRAILREIDYDYVPFSGVMQRMREPCAYAVTGAWIEKKPRPNCTLRDPDPSIFPRRDSDGNVAHPKAEIGPPAAYKN